MSAVRSRSVYEAACESAATTTEREMKFVYDVLAVKAKVGDMRIEGKRVVVAWVVDMLRLRQMAAGITHRCIQVGLVCRRVFASFATFGCRFLLGLTGHQQIMSGN